MTTGDALTPGSLPARVLEHMRVAGGEFEAGELAEALQADLGEVRSAFGTLRKHCLVTTRIEDGHPLYRVAGDKVGMRIPGSAMKPIAIPAKKAKSKTSFHETKLTSCETKPHFCETEHSMAKTTTASPADAILAFLKAHPGGHERADIMAATKLSVATTKRVLNDLQRQHKVQLRGWAKQARWYLASENTPAIASGKKAGAKSPKPAKAKPNLADYGAASKPAPKTGVAFAIDATGTVAIENLRLPPAEIERLVDFLQRTQHVWKGAPA